MRQQLALAWLSFAFLALGVAPAPGWSDAGELAAAGAELGVMHPPGVPGLVLVHHLSAALPAGTLGFRQGLVVAAAATSCLLLLASILRRRGAHPAVVWGAAAWVLLGVTFVRHARGVEIYAVGTLLGLAFLWGFDPRAHARTSARLLGTTAAVVGAWGFGDLRLALVPPVGVLWVRGLARGEPWARWAPLVVAASSAVVLTLPLCSAHGPAADWGDPQTLARLWSHVQAEAIRVAFVDEVLPASSAMWWLHLRAAGARLGEDLGAFGPVVATAAVIAWARRPGDRGLLVLVLVLAAVELFYAVGINPMGGADRQTGMLFGPLAALCVGVAAQDLTARLPRARWALLPLGFVLLALPPALGAGEELRIARSWMPHAWTRDALDRLAPGAVMLTQSDDLSAGAAAARALEGARPDVVVLVAQHLHKPGPDRPGEREAGLRRAARTGRGEAERISAVLEHARTIRAPIELEGTGTGVLAGVGSPIEARRLATRIEDLLQRWAPRAESSADRRRVARAVDVELRGAFSSSAAAPEAWALAEAAYVRVLHEVDPDHVPSLLGLSAVLDGTGRTAQAIPLARRALELDPGDASALLTLALYLSRADETRREAVEVALRAVALRPRRAEAWRRLELVARAAGDAELAQRAHDKAAEWGGPETSGR